MLHFHAMPLMLPPMPLRFSPFSKDYYYFATHLLRDAAMSAFAGAAMRV